MPNVTMTLDEDVLRKVRRIAVEKDTTLTAMVREYLSQLAARKTQTAEDTIEQMRRSFDDAGVVVGPRTWTREDLHAR